MSPIAKDTDLLNARDSSARLSVTSTRTDELSSRAQPVALEVSVTVNGARTVDGSDKREPFSESTKTVLVFGNGAVIRLSSPVAPGQLLFLTNEKTKKEVVCQVVKSKSYRNVSGYVELEFTESVVGFWGMRFPGDRIGPQSSVPVTPVPPSAPAHLPALASTQLPAPKIGPPAAEKLTPPAPAAPVAAKSEMSSIPVPVKPVMPVVPATPAFDMSRPIDARPSPIVPSTPPSTAASTLAELESIFGVKPVVPSAPPAAKAEPARAASDPATEALKLQTVRLQEQLSSLLLSTPQESGTEKQAPPSPASDTSTSNHVAAKSFELARPEPAALTVAPPTKTFSAPMTSLLDSEETKIPAWLEPLVRNASAPASTQELIEREKARRAAELSDNDEPILKLAPIEEHETESEAQVPTFGSGPLAIDDQPAQESPAHRSNRGVLIGAIAAGILVLAGGAWYLRQPATPTMGRTPVTVAASTQAPSSSPAQLPQAVIPTSSQSQPLESPKPSAAAPARSLEVRSETSFAARESTKNPSTVTQAAERIAEPAAPQPKKPVLGDVHLASPKLNRDASAEENSVPAPTLASGEAVPPEDSLSNALAPSNTKQPVAPAAPAPVGGDVHVAKIVSTVSPIYPALARNQHVSGDVRVDALIDEHGRVTTMKVVSGPTLLHQAAMDALRQWRYQPATLDGKPVPMHLTVTLQFRLQ